MLLSLTYRRPPLVRDGRASARNDTAASSSPNGSITSFSPPPTVSIPDELSLDSILRGHVCSPCTVRDFMGYLKYVEYNAEPLQFLLWYRSYASRFEALVATEKAVSPAWSVTEVNSDLDAVYVGHKSCGQTKFTVVTELAIDGCDKLASLRALFDVDKPASLLLSGNANYTRQAQAAFVDAGLEPPLAADQPFREEINNIIAIYFASEGPRQLNLDARERRSVLRALRTTTHPSAFRAALASVEYSLRYQSHANFIRWSLCNGNPPRAMFGKALGVITILLALVASVIVTLSRAPRAWRVVPLVGWILGISMLVAGLKGMCIVIFATHSRQERPWNLRDDDLVDEIGDCKQFDDTESMVSALDNAWEHEPWVARYKKRALISKIFDRETWVQEPMLRKIQNTIVAQSMVWGLLIGGLVTGIFCALPGGYFF